MGFSWLEITGFLFGIAGVYLTVRQNKWCFPVGLVNVTVSLVLFFEQRLYSDVVQQAVYILLLTYGWYQWVFRPRATPLTVSRTGLHMRIVLIVLNLTLTLLLGWFFSTYTDADVPYLDAFATSMSFTAQFLIARKKIENWQIWMAVNLLYIGIYFYKDLYLYVVLFAIYLFLAVKGYIEWRKSERQSMPDKR